MNIISQMFYGCSSLIYLNLKTFKLGNSVNKDNAFDGISPYVKYCIEDSETKDILGIISDCSDETLQGYYLDINAQIYKKCYEYCKYCYGEGNETINNCIECISNFTFYNNSMNIILL